MGPGGVHAVSLLLFQFWTHTRPDFFLLDVGAHGVRVHLLGDYGAQRWQLLREVLQSLSETRGPEGLRGQERLICK